MNAFHDVLNLTIPENLQILLCKTINTLSVIVQSIKGLILFLLKLYESDIEDATWNILIYLMILTYRLLILR